MSNSFRRKVLIKADDQGNIPTEIQVLLPGEWHTPYHGDFNVSLEDLAAYVANYNEIYVSRGEHAPMNYAHEGDIAKGSKAAGWIKELVNRGSDGLWAVVEWTTTALEEIKAGEWKYISPEFWPLGWTNPEDRTDIRNNVFEGAALTNTPLFKGLEPIAADANRRNIIYIKGDSGVDLEKLRKKQPADLTDDEKKYLADNSDKLTAEERKTFDLQTDEDKKAEEAAASKEKEEADDEAKAKADAEKQKKEASAKRGTVTISAKELAALKASAQKGEEAHRELQHANLTQKINAHVERGAVKSSQVEEAVGILMAAAPALRTRLESFLDELPDNQLVKAGEVGDGGSAGEGLVKASERLSKLAEERAAKDKIDFGKALRIVSDENPELAKQYQEGDE